MNNDPRAQMDAVLEQMKNDSNVETELMANPGEMLGDLEAAPLADCSWTCAFTCWWTDSKA